MTNSPSRKKTTMNDKPKGDGPVITDQRPFWYRLNTAGTTPSSRTARRAAAKIAAQFRKGARV